MTNKNPIFIQYLRACGVNNTQVLSALEETKRELFVPEVYKEIPDVEHHIPIGHGQLMLTQREYGLVLQALTFTAQTRILEIGTANGYLTSLLTNFCHNITTMEIHNELLDNAKENLTSTDETNIRYICGDGLDNSLNEQFDIIITTAAIHRLPKSFDTQLKENGQIIVFIGTSPCINATLYIKTNEHLIEQKKLFITDVPQLSSDTISQEFVL